jgi:hypothetical protein
MIRNVLRGLTNATALAVVLFLGVLIVARPLHMRWGSNAEELRLALPGDEMAPNPMYQIQRAVTIQTPAEAIWPWLAQLGHDKGGFYSYAGLENLFGLYIVNADRVHPEWQQIATGDSVFATPLDYLGTGRRFGWRVGRAEPNRVLVLESWGAFVLYPLDCCTTKLIVRIRGGQSDNLYSLLLAPLGFLLFEPVHFIMERKMLLEIRERAERLHQTRRVDHRNVQPMENAGAAYGCNPS